LRLSDTFGILFADTGDTLHGVLLQRPLSELEVAPKSLDRWFEPSRTINPCDLRVRTPHRRRVNERKPLWLIVRSQIDRDDKAQGGPKRQACANHCLCLSVGERLTTSV
jgi:hypothetical protein